jgi:hypothetical protein
MSATKIGTAVLYGLNLLPAAAALGKPELLPPSITKAQALTATAAGVLGSYLGGRAWKAHPFLGALAGSIVAGLAVGAAFAASADAAKTAPPVYDGSDGLGI